MIRSDFATIVLTCRILSALKVQFVSVTRPSASRNPTPVTWPCHFIHQTKRVLRFLEVTIGLTVCEYVFEERGAPFMDLKLGIQQRYSFQVAGLGSG